MHVDWRFTGDGILAFVGGASAIIAVLLSNRRSLINLERQLGVEEKTRSENSDRQKRALAKAVLFEINNFYCYYVRDVQAFLKEKDVENCKLLGIKSISPDPFPIYRGNAITVGVLEDDLVGNIVGFYSTAEAYLSTLRDYKAESERYYQNSGNLVAEEKARTFLTQMKSTGPEITKLIHVLCEELCKVASVEFRAPTIAVAAEGLKTEQIAASLEGVNAKTH